jgi:hypothetical protein
LQGQAKAVNKKEWTVKNIGGDLANAEKLGEKFS